MTEVIDKAGSGRDSGMKEICLGGKVSWRA